jgi:hypothetical protein
VWWIGSTLRGLSGLYRFARSERQAPERQLQALLLARSNQEPCVSGAAASDGKCPLGVGSGGWLEGDLVAERFELA